MAHLSEGPSIGRTRAYRQFRPRKLVARVVRRLIEGPGCLGSESRHVLVVRGEGRNAELVQDSSVSGLGGSMPDD